MTKKLLLVFLASFAAVYVKGFLDEFLDWLAEFFINNDDNMVSHTVEITFDGKDAKWLNGTGDSDLCLWNFSVSDGAGL